MHVMVGSMVIRNRMPSKTCCCSCMHCGNILSETLYKGLRYVGFDVVICKDCLQNKKEEIDSEFLCEYNKQLKKILVLLNSMKTWT